MTINDAVRVNDLMKAANIVSINSRWSECPINTPISFLGVYFYEWHFKGIQHEFRCHFSTIPNENGLSKVYRVVLYRDDLDGDIGATITDKLLSTMEKQNENS